MQQLMATTYLMQRDGTISYSDVPLGSLRPTCLQLPDQRKLHLQCCSTTLSEYCVAREVNQKLWRTPFLSKGTSMTHILGSTLSFTLMAAGREVSVTSQAMVVFSKGATKVQCERQAFYRG